MIAEHIRPDQNDRNRRYDVNSSTRQNYRSNRFRENFRRDYRQDTRERYRSERNNNNDRIRDRNRSRDRNFTGELWKETEALTAVDPDQDPEQVQIGTE